MSHDDPATFYARLDAELEAVGIGKVRASLAEGTYTGDKRALVEMWLGYKDAQRDAILTRTSEAIQRGNQLLEERSFFALVAHNFRQVLHALHTLGTAIIRGKPLAIWYALIGFLLQTIVVGVQALVSVAVPLGLLVLLWYAGKWLFF
jgi:hypothetical protein